MEQNRLNGLFRFAVLFLVIWSSLSDDLHAELQTLVCLNNANNVCELKPRRYDIEDLGHPTYFHGWVDVQGQGVANDYCRIVGDLPDLSLSCALAGTHGCSDQNYNSIWNFEVGHTDTWYMKDEDNDQRDDYCRCLGPTGIEPSQVVCTKAGPKGFFGSHAQGGETNTFSLLGTTNCEKNIVRPEFGKEYTIL